MQQVCVACGAPLPEGARFCPACATPVAPEGEEERKLVSVLFADVTGSTALGERLDPERLRDVMQEWFSVASAAIEAWGGTIEKFIGDAVVAVFGVPVLREDDAQRALHAALDMLDRLPALNRRALSEHGVDLNVRIGVNTGEVLVPRGSGGGGPLVVGDAVNVAARLQAAAEPSAVLVGERTYLAARANFRFGDPLQLDLKGKAAPVGARRLLGIQADAGRGVPGLRAPMIGRDRELSTLLDALEDTASESHPSLVLVFGPAGLGKSRLLQEFVRAVATREAAGRLSAQVVRTRCLAVGKAVTYWPLAEMLRAVAGVSLDEPAESARAKVEQTVTHALEGSAQREMVATTVHALALTAGIRLPDNPLTELQPAAAAEEMGRAWPRFLSALAAQRPLVIAIEDLHWASSELLVMCERIVRRSSGPVLVVATARPEFEQEHPGFASASEDVSRVTLRPLSTREGDELLDALLSDVELPAKLRAKILQRVEGNPFFLEEILRQMIDEGRLIREGERWRLTDPSALVPLPDTVLSLLASRIDTLPANEKRAVQEASVVGRIFWEEPVRQLVGENGLHEALTGLESRGLVSVRPTSSIRGEVEYIFKHALVRDVAYAGLPRRRRARAHAGVAAWMERMAAERGEEFLDLIAHHYGEAVLGDDADLGWQGEPDERERVRGKAFHAFLAAGSAARQRYEVDTALEHHSRALELAVDEEEQAQAHEALGDDYGAAFRGDEAWRHYSVVLDRVTASHDPATVGRIALRMAGLGTKQGVFKSPPPPADLAQLIGQGLATADERTDLRARLLVERSFLPEVLSDEGLEVPARQPQSGSVHLEEAAEIARGLGDPDLEFMVTSATRYRHEAAGNRDAALASLEQMLQLLPSVRNASWQAFGSFVASSKLRSWLADFERALETGRRVYELGRNLSAHELMHGTTAMMIPLFQLGRWTEMEPLLAEHVALWRDERDRQCGAIRAGPLLGALLRSHQGNAEEARSLLDMTPYHGGSPATPETLAICPIPRIDDYIETYVNLGEPEVARDIIGDVARLRSHFALGAALDIYVALADWDALRTVLAFARERVPWNRLLAPTADRAEGRMLALTGERVAGAALLRRAIADFDALKVSLEAARARELLADAVDDRTERARLLGEALESYEALGATLHARRLRDRR
jgi:class 3 adenylate cyclase/tetratricopeptide (TPR) repeat protein